MINETHKMEIKWQIDDKKKEEGGETWSLKSTKCSKGKVFGPRFLWLMNYQFDGRWMKAVKEFLIKMMFVAHHA